MKSFLKNYAIAAVVLFLRHTQPSFAQINRLEFVVPGGPGSGLDQAARAFEEALKAEKLVSGIQVTHVAGGGGMTAISQFITSKSGNPNAVLANGAGSLIFPLSDKSPVSYESVKPVARIAGEYEILVVRTESEFKTLDDLVGSKSESPFHNMGRRLRGSTDHIFYALISKAVGIEPKRLNFIPHANTGEIVAAVLGGHVAVGGGGYQDFAPQIEAGKIRVLAVGAPDRLKGIDAPTLKEKGLDVL